MNDQDYKTIEKLNPSDEVESMDEYVLNNDSNHDDMVVHMNSDISHKPNKMLTTKAVADFKIKKDRTGMVYMSRVPPFMQPHRVKTLLSKYGEIGKIYLSAENAKTAKRRRKYKGNSRKNYTEGWIEFMDKRVAKLVASTLNNTQIGGKKTSRYYDDIWNIRYLPRFKWSHLTEQLAYEKKQREQRLRAEIRHTKRENQVYVNNVERGKINQRVEDQKKRKRNETISTKVPSSEQTSTSNLIDTISIPQAEELGQIRRTFRQRKVVVDPEERVNVVGSDDLKKVKSVLSKIF